MKKNLLYIGNKLSEHGMTVTSIETLGLLLEKEGYGLCYASVKKNKVCRLFDMLVQTIRCRKKVDYVLIDTYSTYNFWYAFFVSQLCRIVQLKCIPILHGGDLPSRLAKNPRLCRMVFRHSYRNIVPSGYLFEAFSGKGFSELIHIPNAIELGNYPFRQRKVKPVPKLLWVRSFTDIYNPKMALEVLKKLSQEYPGCQLCMVGPDKDGTLKEIQAMSKKLRLDIRFPGKLSKPDWIKLSAEYDIFINTSHYDNTPVSVIEAIALGLPVVTTNVGGIPYLLEHKKSALLVADNDANAMTDAIKELVNNQALRENVISNGYNVVSEFDWVKVKSKWDAVLI